MLMKYFYDSALAHASYLVGCQRSGEAIVIDPGRDIDHYLETARREGLKLTAVFETHIHADFVSGARELADRENAKLYFSDEGDSNWKYEYVSAYPHQLLKDGDVFSIGKIEFRVMHTPGHTPESLSLILTDRGGGADQPMGVFTGDFVFVGSMGRPDLLEEAAGMAGTAEPGARDLFQSIQKFKQLPEFLQVWPAHGAGSACGKGLGAIPSSTVGYELRFNPAFQIDDEQEFVDYILADQPAAPKYFALMKRVNKQGPMLIGNAELPTHLDVDMMPSIAGLETVIDTRSAKNFAHRHVPGTINIPLPMLATWAGSLVEYDHAVFLVTNDRKLPEAVRILRKIGLDNISGYFDNDEIADAVIDNESLTRKHAVELEPLVVAGQVELIDVRDQAEWDQGHIPQAKHIVLNDLAKGFGELDRSKPLVVHCRSGARSAIAVSLLRAAGFKDVTDMLGGIEAWQRGGLPVEVSSQPATTEIL